MNVIGEQCDVCGQNVPADDMVKTELTVAGAMCPTAMTFHTACYEKASAMWQPDPESYCTTDPLFPETGQWVLPEDARARAALGAEDRARAALGAEDRARAALGAEDRARAALGAEDRARAALGAEDRARAALGAEDRARAALGAEDRAGGWAPAEGATG